MYRSWSGANTMQSLLPRNCFRWRSASFLIGNVFLDAKDTSKKQRCNYRPEKGIKIEISVDVMSLLAYNLLFSFTYQRRKEGCLLFFMFLSLSLSLIFSDKMIQVINQAILENCQTIRRRLLVTLFFFIFGNKDFFLFYYYRRWL